MKIDDLCKKKGIKERKICERKCGLGVSEILSIQVWFSLSDCKDLKAFYTGVNGEFLHPFFRKCPAIFVFLKQINNCTLNVANGQQLSPRGAKIFATTYVPRNCILLLDKTFPKYGELGAFVNIDNIRTKAAFCAQPIPKVRKICPKAEEFARYHLL